ncbi:hypothetical protein [Segatella buccae]|uniref:hypothetical protein n=1 Tax=Segatella buccae TaxID=28126 RepID=UPI0022E69C4B|nr:hypothetical protein [Segatella buccae]
MTNTKLSIFSESANMSSVKSLLQTHFMALFIRPAFGFPLCNTPLEKSHSIGIKRDRPIFKAPSVEREL